MALKYYICLVSYFVMTSADFQNITLNDYKWLNEPYQWRIINSDLELTTKNNTDFWQGTWYNFYHTSGHVFGVEIGEDFTYTTRVEADFSTLYDQAGLMIYLGEKHWIKAGIEFNDGQPMVGSVLTNEISDWATGVFPGDPRKFWIQISKVGSVVCVKYSIDNTNWLLLRLASFPVVDKYFVGPMACTPTREGLRVKFSDIKITKPVDDVLHGNVKH